MVHLDNSHDVYKPGPFVDDGALYSGAGLEELCHLANKTIPGWNKYFVANQSAFKDIICWQHSVGAQAPQKREIHSSVVFSTFADNGVEVHICHMAIDGSSQ